MVKSLAEEKVQTICILILTSIAVAASLKLFSSVLIPFVLAIFLTFCLSPLIDVQIKWMRAPRFVAILTTILLGCMFLLLISLVVSTTVGQMVENKDDYQQRQETYISRCGDRISLPEKSPLKQENFWEKKIIFRIQSNM